MTPSEMNAAAAQQQQNISSRAMIEEGIKIGRREALLELRMTYIGNYGGAFPEHLKAIDKMLAKDAGL